MSERQRTFVSRRIAADCSLICFDPNTAFFSPRTEFARQYDDYRKLAFFPYDTLFWQHAPRVPLTDRQQQQLSALGMAENRLDYNWQADFAGQTAKREMRGAEADGRNLFWSPYGRYVYDRPTFRYEGTYNYLNYRGEAPVVQLFLDAFPLGDSLAFNSATFLDVAATQLTAEPSQEYNAALNMYFDLSEMMRRDMLTELRAGPADLDFVARTYDTYSRKINSLRVEFFQNVREGRDEVAMQRYNFQVARALGINNLQIFRVHAYAGE